MFTNEIKNYYEKEIEVIKNLDYSKINDTMNLIFNCFDNNNNIYICGNGGSALSASHFASDFNKGVNEFCNKKFNFVCLNDNIGVVMAIANDINYDEVFSYQLKGKITKDDILIVLSGSGNSTNVVKACEYAKKVGAKVIGLTGYNGGKVSKLVDINNHVNIDDMQIVEDIHLTINHVMMRLFCAFFKDRKGNN